MGMNLQSVLESILHFDIYIPIPEEVHNYLTRYTDMIDVVVNVSKKASQKFGSNARLSLEVYHDPEIEDEYLTLYIRCDEYPSKFLEKIEDFRKEHREDLSNKSGWLLVTTDFQPVTGARGN